MKITFKALLLCLVFILPAIAQEGSDSTFRMRVDTIVVTGNKQTEEEIILKELTFSRGDTVDNKTLVYNSERIYSLDIFNHVYLKQDSLDENKLLIIVDEAWYIYPIPFFMLKDRSWDKISYGFDLLIKNFRGRNETIRGRVTFGYDPSYYLSYENPNLVSKEDIFIASTLSYSDVKNSSITAVKIYGDDFTQKFLLAQVDLGKRLNLYNRVALSFFYQYVETPEYYEGVSASNQRIDRLPGFGIGYTYDTRDLVQFPSKGIYAGISAQLKGLGVNDANYQVYNLDFRQYRPLLGVFIAKWRIDSRFTAGYVIPYYDYSYIGLGERIRGHFYDQYEGNNLYLGSAEIAYPIIKELNINLEWVPLLPNALLRYRFAFYTQLFGDAGAIQNNGESFGIDDFHSGYGFGFSFLILPYYILRMEYAFDEYFNPEAIIDFGISF